MPKTDRSAGPSGSSPYLTPVFAGWKATANLFGIAVWLASLAYFWVWWLRPENIDHLGPYLVVTLILAWITLIPSYFIFIFAFARVPIDAGASNAKAAVVVTKAPSEPFEVVRETLLGALAQVDVDHDTWLADEDPSPETLAWCEKNGVYVSTRKGVVAYHQAKWPRRTRCKEGNLAYFYDHYGYERYEFVAQFDADHIPSPTYLKNALVPFADPAVGYVSAPSICDANANASWSARGRLYLEASMHGALQTGYNSGWAPLCIGSHYTVRTSALREIGGLGPELAEDHSTTLMFNSGGWRGVHAVNAIAHGDGPETFTHLVVQEFQWSRSLVTILCEYSPRLIGSLPPRLKFQFLFSQFWYPLFSIMMALSLMLPSYALLTGRYFVNVTYIDYFLHILPLSVVMIILAYWWRATGLFRPPLASIISWEGMAFLFARWPWSLLGSVVAVRDWLFGVIAEFRVTPKKSARAEALPFWVLSPYLGISLVCAIIAWGVEDPGTAGGFYIFNLMIAAIYVGLVILIVV
ncbi:MAG: glycosyltransferase, partial [Rhizobiales bacterium]|nr:glycosyltransferase [Hyphomicrobiales bacterium]